MALITPARTAPGEGAETVAAMPFPRVTVLADYRLAWESRHASVYGRREVFSGKAKFGIDAFVANMLYAKTAYPPTREGGKHTAVDDSQARKVKGWVKTIVNDQLVAVVATSYSSAVKARPDSTRIPIARKNPGLTIRILETTPGRVGSTGTPITRTTGVLSIAGRSGKLEADPTETTPPIFRR